MKTPPCAYTLIECVLALGLVGMVLMSLLALLPMGMSTMVTGGRRVTEGRILRQLQTGCRVGLPTEDLYFNREGASLGTVTDAAFVVRLAPEAGVMLPGDTVPSLPRVKLMISDQPRGSPFANELHVTAHFLLLAEPLERKGGS